MNYKLFSHFIYRSPFLSIDDLPLALTSKEELLIRISDKKIQEAIFLASPVLYKELLKLSKGVINDKKEFNRILYSAERYVSRMSTRCTPFGLFAGCGIGTISDTSCIVLGKDISRITRLDMYFLSTLYSSLTKLTEVKASLRYYPNTSLYRVGRKYRYVEVIYNNFQKNYQIAEVKHSNYLSKVLKIVQNGLSIDSIAKRLTDDEITLEEALIFIENLISSQLIVPELNQTVIGNDYFQSILDLLDNIIGFDSVLTNKLKNIKDILSQLDYTYDSSQLYDYIVNIIKELNINYEEKYLFQVDMARSSVSAYLGYSEVEEIKSAITFLNKITPSFKNDNLRLFQEDFYNRYEDQEIPLLNALDPDIGLGYPSNKQSSAPSPLIDDLALPQSVMQNNINNGLYTILFNKTIDLPDKNKVEIELTDEDVEGLNADWNDLPPTMYAMLQVVQIYPGETLIRLQSCGGSSAANLLTRFAHIHADIEKFIKEITTKEQEILPDSIIAEIVHSPEDRTGNILFRPHIRNYELLYISDSDLPKDQIILLSDLMLSVKQGQLVLRSKKMNKEIIPRLTTAHNYYYRGTLPVYRFLADMQTQTGRNTLYFSWGQVLEEKLTFLPRIRYKNTILSPATWIIKIEDIKKLLAIEEDESLLEKIEKWRERYFLPRYVLMLDGDNELYIDWGNVISVKSLLSLISKRQEIKFTEFLFNPNKAMVKDTNNKTYTNECIVAFYKDN